jgi:hypothetical protein
LSVEEGNAEQEVKFFSLPKFKYRLVKRFHDRDSPAFTHQILHKDLL